MKKAEEKAADMVDAYPLKWPIGKLRTRSPQRAKFGVRSTVGDSSLTTKRPLSTYAAFGRLRQEAAALRAQGLVVSTNLPIRKDGLPLSSAREPDDRGVAVYFMLEGRAHCLACDKWDRVADNLAAIAAHIYAVRGQARWGVGDLAQAFAGHRALSAVGAKQAWWTQLGVPSASGFSCSSREKVEGTHRETSSRPRWKC